MDDIKPGVVARVEFIGHGTALAPNVLPLDHNPQLKPWAAPTPNNVAGKGAIEVPGQAKNLVWQNRAAAPTAFENALGDALEVVFEGGAETAGQVAEGLNRIGFRTPEGVAWTAESLEATLARLGA